MFKRVPIIPDLVNKFDYNTNNLHEYDPYIIEEESNLNVIDIDWYGTLPDKVKTLINQRCKFTLKEIDVPHKVNRDNDEKFLLNIYLSYLEGFDYNNWYSNDILNGPKNIKLIKIDDDIKRILISLYNNNLLTEDDNYLLNNFRNKILTESDNDKYFIRVSSTSGKNEKPVEPFYDVDTIISHLASVELFVLQEYNKIKDSYLILMPWNDKIDTRYEFRIFVFNNKLVGASQQFWSELFQYSEEELETIEYSLANIEFIGKVPYHTFVGDVFIDIENKTCHLIECNPFGAHCGAGSSLFNWEKDYDLLHSTDHIPELRYQSIINY